MQKQHEQKRRHATGSGPIAARIRAKRKRAGLSQSQAAEMWGISKRTLEKWEQGESHPRGVGLIGLEKILSEGDEARKPAKQAEREHTWNGTPFM